VALNTILPDNSPTLTAVLPAELDIDLVLLSGQTFRWQKDKDGWWVSVVTPEGAALRLKREGDLIHWQTAGSVSNDLLTNYFRLEVALLQLRDTWLNQGHAELASSIDTIPGLRLVHQDPVECLVSFLCSSAAPIHRIRRSVSGLCSMLGNELGSWNGVSLFTFPTLERLAAAERRDLDKLGLGFRGRYVIEAAKEVLARGGRDWLVGLRQSSYDEAKYQLIELTGVGEKVADCVCLFSLNKDSAVPIDVHMARVARRQFPECESQQILTAKSYRLASDGFKLRYGDFAGWAQQYFFYAEIAHRGIWDQNLGRHRPRQTG
jgi:N-glycosylase/DNA lyase